MEKERNILEKEVQRQARRRRWVRRLIVGGLAATVGVVALTYWRGNWHKHQSLRRPLELPQNVNQQLSGFTFTRSDGERQVFTIHAARTLAMKQGGTALLKEVYVEFYGRSGKRFDVLRTAEGVYDPSTNNLSIPGSAELILNASKQLPLTGGAPEGEAELLSSAASNPQSVFIETSKVTSRDHSNVVESGTSVRFRMGDVSGSALGLSYAAGRGQLVLKQDVKVIFQPAQRPHAGRPIHLSSSRLSYDDSGRAADLSGPVAVRQGQRTIRAGHGMLSLNDGHRITGILLEGKAHATDRGPKQAMTLDADLLKGHLDPESGNLREVIADGHVHGEFRGDGTVARLEGKEARLSFSGPGQIPAKGKVTGQVHLTLNQTQLPPKPAAGSSAFNGKITREDLTTEALRFAFRQGGRSLREAETLAPGTLVLLPESPKLGPRTATADRFLMDFDEASHPKKLAGSGGTQVVYAAAPGASNQNPSVSTARQLLAFFDPTSVALQSVEQWGNFRFRNGGLEAAAEKAHDSARRQLLVLSGHPKVWDPTARTQADRIILKLDFGTAEGVGHVQAVQFDPQKGSSLPTNVVADRMIAERNSQVVHYEGHVRAWRGRDVVESSSLDVYRTQRRVSSPSRVVTSHLQPASAPQASEAGKNSELGSRSLTIRADRLDYFDAGHNALYTGNVIMDTQDTQLQADRLEVYFASDKEPDASRIERAVATGHVLVTQPQRYAKGSHATYEAKTGKIVMTGGPPSLYDAQKGFTSGLRLTFFIHNDRLLVDGSPGSPTVSKHRVAQ